MVLCCVIINLFPYVKSQIFIFDNLNSLTRAIIKNEMQIV